MGTCSSSSCASAARPDNLIPLAQEEESHEPLKQEVEVSAPLAQEVELHMPNEDDTEGDSNELLADLAAVSPAELGYHQMDEIKEDVTICHQMDADMLSNTTAELGEVFNEDNIVPRDAASNTAAVLTSRSTSPTTANSAVVLL